MKKLIILGVLLVGIAVECHLLLRPLMVDPGNTASIGLYDFQYYYCPFQIFKRGGNPYDTVGINQEYAKISQSIREPLIFIYPPWLLVILSPVLSLDAALAPRIWIALNILFLFASAVLVWKTILPRGQMGLLCALAAVTFVPVFEAIHWGQISVLLLLGTAGFFWAYSRSKDWIAGLCVPILLLKPHLFLLVGIFLLYVIIKEKRYTLIISSLCILAFLLITAEIASPSIIGNWLNNIPAASQHAAHFRNAVLADSLQYLSIRFLGFPLPWLNWTIPLLFIFGLLLYLSKTKNEISFTKTFPGLLCLSIFAAPYGWFYDHSILLVSQVALVALTQQRSIPKKTRNKILVQLLFFQLTTALLSITILHAQHHFFWYPLVLYCIWWKGNSEIEPFRTTP